MESREVRRRVLQQHEELRAILEKLERQAQVLIDSDRSPLQELKQQAGHLAGFLHAHLDFEDRNLAPALEQIPGWGAERSKELTTHHAQQRADLEDAIARIQRVNGSPVSIAQSVLALIEDLREDMAEEEDDLLKPGVLDESENSSQAGRGST